MSATRATAVDVAILGRTYRVKCAAEEVDALRSAARHVDRAMREVQGAGAALGMDRIAVMAALNIANDHLTHGDGSEDVEPQLQRLTAKLDAALKP